MQMSINILRITVEELLPQVDRRPDGAPRSIALALFKTGTLTGWKTFNMQ